MVVAMTLTVAAEVLPVTTTFREVELLRTADDMISVLLVREPNCALSLLDAARLVF